MAKKTDEVMETEVMEVANKTFKEKFAEFGEKHPTVMNVAKTTGKVVGGAALFGLGLLIGAGSGKKEETNDVIDVESSELDDSPEE